MAGRSKKTVADQVAVPGGADARRKALFGNAPGRQQFAMTTPTRAATISSSALRKISDDSQATKNRRRNRATTDRAWQSQVFDYAELVGEFGALLTLQSNVVSLCSFMVQRWDDEVSQWLANEPELDEQDQHEDLPQLEPAKPKPNPLTGEMMDPVEPRKFIAPKPTKAAKPSSEYDDRPSNVMRALVGPDGEQRELIRRGAWNIFAAGEVTLLGTPSKEANGILWEFLSIEELYPNASGDYVRQRGGAGSPQEQLPDDNFTGRCWMSHPRFSDLATSQAKRVLPIMQEIVVLTKMIDAIAQSRLSANMLFIPEEMSFSSSRQGDSPEDADDADDLDEELFAHMTAPIGDSTSASRIVPLLIRGKGEQGQYIKVIELARQFDEFAQSLRREALDRLAKGLDAPPETMAGKGSVSHWTAANVDSEFIVKHIQPVGQRMADFLTTGFLRPMLTAYEDMSEEEAAKFRIEFDPSPVIARADEAKSAMDLQEMLSDEALVTANGFTKADMATGDAIRQRRLWQLVSSQPTTYAKLLPLINGMETIDPALLTAEPPPPPPPPPGALLPGAPKANGTNGTKAKDEKVPKEGNQAPASGAPRATDEPKAKAMRLLNERVDALALLTERLNTAADAAIGRAVDRAASRVISLAQSRAPDLHARIRNVRKPNVMSMCTETDLHSLNVTRPLLLATAWDQLAIDTRGWIAAHLEADGVNHSVADQAGAEAAQELTSRLQAMVADNLLTPFAKSSDGLRVPTGLVAEVLGRAVFAGSR